VCPGRHRGDVAGKQNEESGGGGPGPARRHIRDHRHARLDDRLDDLAHGGLKTAWRINLDQDRLGIDLVGVADTAHHKVGADGFDHLTQVHLNDGGRAGGFIWMRVGSQKAANARQQPKCGNEQAVASRQSAGKGQQEFLIIKMNDVLITAVGDDDSSEGSRLETVSLAFAKIDVSYRPQKADGSLDAGIHFKYDLKAQKGA